MSTLDDYYLLLDISYLEILNDIDFKFDEVLEALDDQVRLFALRDDYVWFSDQIATMFPLGIRTWADEQLVRMYAAATDCSHIVDAFIDGYSLRSAGIELALLDRLLA